MLDTKALVAGRMVCDVKISAMELIRARSYDLASLGCQILGMKEDSLPSYVGSEIRMFFDSSEGIRHFIGWTMEQCLINIKLVNQLQVLPLAMQITAIAGKSLVIIYMCFSGETFNFQCAMFLMMFKTMS